MCLSYRKTCLRGSFERLLPRPPVIDRVRFILRFRFNAGALRTRPSSPLCAPFTYRRTEALARDNTIPAAVFRPALPVFGQRLQLHLSVLRRGAGHAYAGRDRRQLLPFVITLQTFDTLPNSLRKLHGSVVALPLN